MDYHINFKYFGFSFINDEIIFYTYKLIYLLINIKIVGLDTNQRKKHY